MSEILYYCIFPYHVQFIMQGNLSMNKMPDDNEILQKQDDFYDTPLVRQMKENKTVTINHDKAMLVQKKTICKHHVLH